MPPRYSFFSLLASALAVIAAGVTLSRPARAADPYFEQRAAAVTRCAAIDRSEYQTGLALNPDGYRSYYVRSQCFQQAAQRYRDESLCREVRERWSLLWSSWGYSKRRCHELVAEALAADRRALEAVRAGYGAGPVRLTDFTIVRNGNGRDFDVIPSLAPGYAHGYTLRVEILAPDGGAAALVADSGFYLRGGENIRMFVRQEELRRRFPAFELGRPYAVRGTLLLSVSKGAPGGMPSAQFIEQVFPERERKQVMEKEVTF